MPTPVGADRLPQSTLSPGTAMSDREMQLTGAEQLVVLPDDGARVNLLT
ncbi:MAG TPA: hypothetical protein VMW47_11875 [Verrucomicrobiae bacterium]|nr:hypothetical protein [Verrucomicrobiae bacterium]